MKFAMIAVLGAAVASPVLAGGLTETTEEPVVQAAPVVVAPASGDWTGAYVGGQLSYGDIGTSPSTAEGDGALYGLRAGYDYDFGNFVLGGSLQHDFSDIDLGGGDSLDGVTSLRVRGGYDLGPTLVYASAGVAQAYIDAGGSDVDDTGWLAGIGVEHKVSDRMSLTGDVTYHQFDDFDGSSTDVDATTFGAGVNFRF